MTKGHSALWLSAGSAQWVAPPGGSAKAEGTGPSPALYSLGAEFLQGLLPIPASTRVAHFHDSSSLWFWEHLSFFFFQAQVSQWIAPFCEFLSLY